MRIKKVISALLLFVFTILASTSSVMASKPIEIPLPTRRVTTTKSTDQYTNNFQPALLPSLENLLASLSENKPINRNLTDNSPLDDDTEKESITEELVTKKVGKKQKHVVPLGAMCPVCLGTNLKTSGKAKKGLKLTCMDPNCAHFKREFLHGVNKHHTKSVKARCIPTDLGKDHPCPNCGCQHITAVKINGYERIHCCNAVCRKVFTQDKQYPKPELPVCPECEQNDNTFIFNPKATMNRKAYCYTCGEAARNKDKPDWLDIGTFTF